MSAKKPSILDRLLGRAASERQHDETAFAPDFLAQVERLRVAALKAMGGGLREGHRLGAYKGGQLEFHGHRDYTPGDELRYLDWNGYARLGRPYIKEFAREEAGVLHVAIDATASMHLGAPSKFTFARRVAALFVHVALASQDSAHVSVLRNSGPGEHFPPRGKRATTRDYLAFLEKCETDEFEAVEESSEVKGEAWKNWTRDFLKRGARRGGVIFIGDFWEEEQTLATNVSLLTQAGFDISAIHTLAREELEPPADGEILARSIEDGEEAALWFGSGMPGRYATELEKHRAAIEAIFRRRGGRYLFATSDTALEKVLLGTLRQKRWLI